MHSVLFVTGNANKLAEVTSILDSALIQVRNAALDIPEIQGTLEEIARDKCRRAAEMVQGPVLVEDSALEFTAMNGLPGPYIKHFFESLGNDGLIKLIDPFEDRSAAAVSTFAFAEGPGEEPAVFQGRLEGRIVSPRGPTGFGWQPIFEIGGETLAEMSREKKNGMSHRYQALCKLQEWLQEKAKN
ncbi:non-canonical purine NTP pyrophosphatase [Aspergillus candidus]|uniref:Inosine triphosphate pyrophosphatase n=1 Tax=Aspergillus candidus TaxID=41067 RepID=A0A2I2FFU4_ASPCN|nr:inosine triphosphate pyrophosphatase [Aspergillus candidus]PLB39491.1 inosine triphosphate pyrophosphatase [Aspergillus candidus]